MIIVAIFLTVNLVLLNSTCVWLRASDLIGKRVPVSRCSGKTHMKVLAKYAQTLVKNFNEACDRADGSDDELFNDPVISAVIIEWMACHLHLEWHLRRWCYSGKTA